MTSGAAIGRIARAVNFGSSYLRSSDTGFLFPRDVCVGSNGRLSMLVALDKTNADGWIIVCFLCRFVGRRSLLLLLLWI